MLLCSWYLFAAQETGVSLLRVLSLFVQDQTQVRLEVRWPRRRMVLVLELVPVPVLVRQVPLVALGNRRLVWQHRVWMLLRHCRYSWCRSMCLTVVVHWTQAV